MGRYGVVSSSGGSAPSGGGSFAGVDPALLGGSSNARAQTLGKFLQESNKPQSLAPGGTLVRPDGTIVTTAPMAEPGIQVQNAPGGGQVANPVQNYAEAKAAQEAAIARARADQELKTINVGGRDVTKTVGQWRAEMGGGQTQPNPAPRPIVPNSTERGMASSVSAPNDPAATERQVAALRGDLAKVPDAKSKAMIQEEIDRLQASAVAPRNSAGTLVQGQTPAEAKYDTTRAEDFAKRASAIQTAASSASGTLRNLDTLEQLFKDPNVAKGGAAENISGLKNLAASAGVDIKGVGAEQGVQAITNKMALDSRSTAEGGGMPGAMSDADRNFLANQQPGLSKTPEGRAIIIDNARKLAQRQVEVARMAQQYERDHGRIDAGFDRQLQEFADKNQMFSEKKSPAAAQVPDIRALAAQELARRQKGGS